MRLDDKITEIELILEELIGFVPSKFAYYQNNSMVKSACERHFEKISEALVDLSFLLVRAERWENPEEEEGVFVILFKHNIIAEVMLRKLKDIKSMRNILAHQYGEVDDEMVFNSITEELEQDVNEFIKNIKQFLNQ